MKKFFSKKHFILFIVSIISVFIMHAIFSRSNNNHSDSSAVSSVNVNVVHVNVTDVPMYVKGIGSLYANNKVDISPQIAGQISGSR